jgi:hypothetical protein
MSVNFGRVQLRHRRIKITSMRLAGVMRSAITSALTREHCTTDPSAGSYL